MTAWRRAVELALESEDVARLTSIARSRAEPGRAGADAAGFTDASFFAVGEDRQLAHGRRVHSSGMPALRRPS
jgi:hypothetical protein